MEEKRYTTWTDETFWGDNARNNGLVYGVYDNKLNKKVYSQEFIKEFGIITSMERAKEVANIMNKRLQLKEAYGG